MESFQSEFEEMSPKGSQLDCLNESRSGKQRNFLKNKREQAREVVEAVVQT